MSSYSKEKRVCVEKPKRPCVYYGLVDSYEKSYDPNNPNRFDVLLKVSMTRWNQESYLDRENEDPQMPDQITVILQGDWSSTVIQVGNLVNVIILTPSQDPYTVFVSSSADNSNFIIVHPDRLIQATTLSNSFNCLRRGILGNFVNTYHENKDAIFGRLRHDLLEVGNDFWVDTHA